MVLDDLSPEEIKELLENYMDKVDSPERLALFQSIGQEKYADATLLNLMRRGTIAAMNAQSGNLVQDNAPRSISFLVPATDFEGNIPSAAYVAARLNNLSVNITETQTPVLVWILVSGTSPIKKHLYLFTKGKGNYGSGGTTIIAGWITFLLTQNATTDDLEENSNTSNVIIPLYNLADGDYVTAANAVVRDFTDSGTLVEGVYKTYYFSYSTNGTDLYFVQFVGAPAIYGPGQNTFISNDFISSTNNEVTLAAPPTLDEVLTAGNTSPHDLDIGRLYVNSTPASDVGLMRLGNGENTDTYSTAAISEVRDITGSGVWNGMNVEIRPNVQIATLAQRMRAIKGVVLINPNGATLSDVGGGMLGVEGVARLQGLGNVLVATGLYGRVLNDNNVAGSIIENAVGLHVPTHSGGTIAKFKNAIGAALSEQNNPTRHENSIILLLGNNLGNGGKAPTGYTGSHAIYNMSAFANYLAGNLGLGVVEPSEKLEVTGNAKINGNALVQNLYAQSDNSAVIGETTRRFSLAHIIQWLGTTLRYYGGGSGINFRNGNNILTGTIFNSGNWNIGSGTNDTGFKVNIEGTLRVTGAVTAADVIYLGQFTNATEPTLVPGAKYYNTTIGREMIGTAFGWAVVESNPPVSSIQTVAFSAVPGAGLYRVNGTFTSILTTTNLRSGMRYRYKNVGTGVVTLQGQGGATIDGGSSYALGAGKYIQVTFDGANFIITI